MPDSAAAESAHCGRRLAAIAFQSEAAARSGRSERLSHLLHQITASHADESWSAPLNRLGRVDLKGESQRKTRSPLSNSSTSGS